MATTLSTNLTQIIEIKDAIKTAIANRNVDTSKATFADFATLIGKIDDGSATIASLRSQLATANSTIATQKTTISDLNTQVSNLTSANSTLSTQKANLEKQISDATTQTTTILS